MRMIAVKEAAILDVKGSGQGPPLVATGVTTGVNDDSSQPVQWARIQRNEYHDEDAMDLFDDLIQWQQHGSANDDTNTHDQIDMSCRDELVRYKNEVCLNMFCDTQDVKKSSQIH